MPLTEAYAPAAALSPYGTSSTGGARSNSAAEVASVNRSGRSKPRMQSGWPVADIFVFTVGGMISPQKRTVQWGFGFSRRPVSVAAIRRATKCLEGVALRLVLVIA